MLLFTDEKKERISPALRNLTSDFDFLHLLKRQTRLKNPMEYNSRNNKH